MSKKRYRPVNRELQATQEISDSAVKGSEPGLGKLCCNHLFRCLPATAPEEFSFFLLRVQQSSRVPGMDWELVSNTLKLTARGEKDNVWMCSSEVRMKANFSVSISRL